MLSNVHCVERKSISDLFGSFASGQLYTQAEEMFKYYTWTWYGHQDGFDLLEDGHCDVQVSHGTLQKVEVRIYVAKAVEVGRND